MKHPFWPLANGLVAVACLILTGCNDIDGSLAHGGELITSDEYVGDWHHLDGEQDETVAVRKNGSGYVYTDLSRGAVGDPAHTFFFQVVQLGDQRYLQLFAPDGTIEVIRVTRVDPNAVDIAYLDTQAVRARLPRTGKAHWSGEEIRGLLLAQAPVFGGEPVHLIRR
jgi:hypothetical protein